MELFVLSSLLASYIGSIHQVFSGVKYKCKFNVLKLVFKLKLVLKLMLVLMFILKLVFKHFVWSKTRWVGPLLGCMTFVTSMVKLGSTSIEMPCLTAIFSSSLPTYFVGIYLSRLSFESNVNTYFSHVKVVLTLFTRVWAPSLSTQTHVTKIPYSLWVKSVIKVEEDIFCNNTLEWVNIIKVKCR